MNFYFIYNIFSNLYFLMLSSFSFSFFEKKNIYNYLKNCFFFFLKPIRKIKKNKKKNNLFFYSTCDFSFKSYYYFFLKKNFIIYWYFNFLNINFFKKISFISYFFLNFKKVYIIFLFVLKKTFGDGYYSIRNLFFILFIDSLITDDEPLWEPIEWSLFQTWLLFIFIFAWIAENLITSRYGSYTGRDKRVWMAWYKSFWLIELIYIISYCVISMFVIVPFYYELTYSLSFIYSWWNWYNKIFFFKFLSLYSIVILISYFFLLNIKWLNWKKLFVFICSVIFFLSYLTYTQFIITFFSYFTDPLWYTKTRFIDFIQLSHEPLKWGWGPAKRDHFTYHKVSTVFWFKNDSPFAGAFLMFNLFIFLCLFFLLIYWIVLARKTISTHELTFTFSTYCVSSLKQFFFFFLFLLIFIFVSFIVCYWRFPIEFIWLINANSWISHFMIVFIDYFFFIFSIIF